MCWGHYSRNRRHGSPTAGYRKPGNARAPGPLTQERLKELLHYDPETGLFTWLRAQGASSVGKRAGYIGCSGYVYIRADKVLWPAHRLAWLYMTGSFPENEIDHVNGDPGLNKWDNLREATSAQNKYNTKFRIDNSSGFRGVSWAPQSNKWRAMIGVGCRLIHIGLFDNAVDANAAYVARAKKEFGAFYRSE